LTVFCLSEILGGMFPFSQVSHDIKIEVSPSFIAEQSDPQRSFYFFSYTVKVTNESAGKVQLLRRQWIIIDGEGKTEEVEGAGVVGLQPKIEAGQAFEYSSFCPLQTPTGSMRGRYLFVDGSGEEFWVGVPEFILSEPSFFH
jgi:ApaG protein